MTDRAMWELYMDIWKERPHVSQISGKWLGKEPLTYMFDHCLEKKQYPEIMYKKWNIALVTLEEHSLKTQGHPLPKHEELIDRAKIKYEEWRKKNLK